ncbi:hypothetical protein ABGB14_08215 [Nonomuraea sp. B10E15]|uniref:hypothetical protein n=1 Tax=Nonomuraea sp. B10E15 TaxID=3153560 RepID=UPI00325D1DF0
MKNSHDELKVPSQRADEVRGDDRDDGRAAADRRPGEEAGGPIAGRPESTGRADGRHEGLERSADEYDPAVPGADPSAEPDEDAAYRDPYARTGGDLRAEPEPGPVDVQAAPEEVPAHAAPQDVVLFDQDPTQVQARWRDLQASFVDDPGEALRRADGLLGEVVESFTSSLTSRTGALRDGWKGTGAQDTEQLRLALRDYRNVLEHLLALSGSPGQAPVGSGQAPVQAPVQAPGQSHSHGMR